MQPSKTTSTVCKSCINWKFKSSGMCHCVDGCVVSNASKDCSAFICRVKHSNNTTLLGPEDEVVQSFKTLGTTQSHIPEDLSLRKHQCCDNLKSPIISTDSTITFSTTTKGRGRGSWKQCQWIGLWRSLQSMKGWNCKDLDHDVKCHML